MPNVSKIRGICADVLFDVTAMRHPSAFSSARPSGTPGYMNVRSTKCSAY